VHPRPHGPRRIADASLESNAVESERRRGNVMTHAVTHDTRSRRNDVREVGEALQEALVDLVDLSLLGKHLHWNVEGLTFRPGEPHRRLPGRTHHRP
jgi:hypothetical protein